VTCAAGRSLAGGPRARPVLVLERAPAALEPGADFTAAARAARGRTGAGHGEHVIFLVRVRVRLGIPSVSAFVSGGGAPSGSSDARVEEPVRDCHALRVVSDRQGCGAGRTYC
jgi:hypothetical protein